MWISRVRLGSQQKIPPRITRRYMQVGVKTSMAARKWENDINTALRDHVAANAAVIGIGKNGQNTHLHLV